MSRRDESSCGFQRHLQQLPHRCYQLHDYDCGRDFPKSHVIFPLLLLLPCRAEPLESSAPQATETTSFRSKNRFSFRIYYWTVFWVKAVQEPYYRKKPCVKLASVQQLPTACVYASLHLALNQCTDLRRKSPHYSTWPSVVLYEYSKVH